MSEGEKERWREREGGRERGSAREKEKRTGKKEVKDYEFPAGNAHTFAPPSLNLVKVSTMASNVFSDEAKNWTIIRRYCLL